MNSEINLKNIQQLLRNNIIFFIITTLFFTGVGYALSHYVMQKTYSSSISLIVTTETSKRADTEKDIYQEILRSNLLIKKAKDKFHLKEPVSQLASNVSINISEQDVSKSTTHTYWLVVNGDDEHKCRKTAIFLSKNLKPELLKVKGVESVKSYGKHQISSMQTAPHYKKITITWGITGFIASIMIVLFSWLYDGSFKRSTDIEEVLDLPVYGIIPSEESAEKVDGKRKDERS